MTHDISLETAALWVTDNVRRIVEAQARAHAEEGLPPAPPAYAVDTYQGQFLAYFVRLVYMNAYDKRVARLQRMS